MKLDKQIVSYLTKDEHNDLCHMVNMEGRSMSYIVRRALLEYMSKHMPPPSIPDSKQSIGDIISSISEGGI